MSGVPKSAWHKKAKFMLKKVLLKPPTDANQLRNLCQNVVTQRYGVDSASTAVMTTALSLWEDPNLVNALQHNQTFQRAKERIQNLSSHILPPSNSGALSTWTSQNNNLNTSNQSRWLSHGPAPENQELLRTSHGIIMDAIEQVMHCPVCGKSVQCLHDDSHHSRSCIVSNSEDNARPETTNILPDVSSETSIDILDSDSSEVKKNYTEGTAGKLPQKDFNQNVADWFGPLVLASFAIVGLALGVFQGEIVLPKLQSVTSRAVVAVKLLMQASNSIFKLIG
mmetsp:Transcript_5018/g.7050  ORF Transcript_5018/g.7050 Transcript_5018/m.7050 type:complete len:281 (+) Transcript_5018:140-982(+)